MSVAPSKRSKADFNSYITFQFGHTRIANQPYWIGDLDFEMLEKGASKISSVVDD